MRRPSRAACTKAGAQPAPPARTRCCCSAWSASGPRRSNRHLPLRRVPSRRRSRPRTRTSWGSCRVISASWHATRWCSATSCCRREWIFLDRWTCTGMTDTLARSSNRSRRRRGDNDARRPTPCSPALRLRFWKSDEYLCVVERTVCGARDSHAGRVERGMEQVRAMDGGCNPSFDDLAVRVGTVGKTDILAGERHPVDPSALDAIHGIESLWSVVRQVVASRHVGAVLSGYGVEGRQALENHAMLLGAGRVDRGIDPVFHEPKILVPRVGARGEGLEQEQGEPESHEERCGPNEGGRHRA